MSVPRLEQPIGEAAPYIIPAYGGERLLIPGTKSTIRILASAKESGKLISVFHMDGVTGDAPGFHYHNEAHDVFLCTKGKMKVWAGDQCRILNPGDFCAVPPVCSPVPPGFFLFFFFSPLPHHCWPTYGA